MSTVSNFKRSDIGPGKVGFAKTRSIIEAPFYGNNVVRINTLKEAYKLAAASPGTIITDLPVYHGEDFGLEPNVTGFEESINLAYLDGKREGKSEGYNQSCEDTARNLLDLGVAEDIISKVDSANNLVENLIFREFAI